MAESLNTLPHDFEFTEDDRSYLTLSDVRLDPLSHNVTLVADDDGNYPITGEQYVISGLFSPGAVRQWVGFQVFITHTNNGLAQVTGDGYRLHDDTDMWFWDGGAWAVASSGDWNTEAEIAANISTFPATARKLRVVVRLTTTDKLITPVLKSVRVAWKGKVFAFEDLLYRTLVPMLKTARIVSDLAIKVAFPGGTSMDVGTVLDALGQSLDVVDVEAVFNYSTDPGAYNNLLASYNPTTRIATLASAVPVGQYALVRLVLRPQVSVENSSHDYTEVEKVPAIQLVDAEAVDSQELSQSSEVVNKATGVAIRIPPPYRFNLRFTMIVLAPGGVDLTRALDSIVELVQNTPLITSAATGEQNRFWMTEEFRNTTHPSANNVHAFQASFMVEDVLAFKKPAVVEVAVINVNLN